MIGVARGPEPRRTGVSLRAARIVSLVPSITETVCELGFADRLVGRTRFCVAPAADVAGVPTVGGTKTPDLAAVVALAPDLVLANREENVEASVKGLEAAGIPVLVTDVRTVAAARAFVAELQDLLSGRLATERSSESSRARARREAPRVVTLVWKTPLVAVGEDTYASDLLATLGFANALEGEPSGDRYPRPTLEALAALRPAAVVLPSEPYSWSEAEARRLESDLAARGARTLAVRVPGDALTWWGTRTERALLALAPVLARIETDVVMAHPQEANP